MWSCEWCIQRWHIERCMMFRALAAPQPTSNEYKLLFHMRAHFIITNPFGIYNALCIYICVCELAAWAWQPANQPLKRRVKIIHHTFLFVVSMCNTLHEVRECEYVADVLHCTSNGRQIVVICSAFSFSTAVCFCFYSVCCNVAIGTVSSDLQFFFFAFILPSFLFDWLLHSWPL